MIPLALALVLTWSDEFNSQTRAPIDASKWKSVESGEGFGNYEREYATRTNAFQDGSGHLVIRANEERLANVQCWYGACDYTSARLVTAGAFSQRYGRFEARMKVPAGTGLVSAFWMMGVNGKFPLCGEIDVMEVLGRDPGNVYGSAHEPSSKAPIASTINRYASKAGALSDQFHVYAMEWGPRRIEYFLDGVPYAAVTPERMPPGGTWVFDRQPFYLILDLAVGGNWPGLPDETTTFPADLLVDYVRVYAPN